MSTDAPVPVPRVPGVLLTGHPSAGKSTLAGAVARSLADRGLKCQVLDGDELRAHQAPPLGFSREDRGRQFAGALSMAQLLAASGAIPILALVAPFAADRATASTAFAGAGWIEIYLDPPPEVCIERDSRGVYATLKARGGHALVEAEVFGIYEPPVAPALRLDTSRIDIASATDAIVELIVQRSSQNAESGGRRGGSGRAVS